LIVGGSINHAGFHRPGCNAGLAEGHNQKMDKK
jgi:hypothetical protein